ncbi:MAG: carbon monoxide dehydrogenase [Pseudomonadota bacterium]|nr:xanthine dehydrogenase family protein subunit M [Rubrivivax sp.]
MQDFAYFAPRALDEAVALLGADDAGVLAGGTDLIVQMREGVRRPARVVDIKKIAGLDDFGFDARGGLVLGALVTTRQVETSPVVRRHYASLARAATDFASIQVRHRATVVGNVCRASPSADTLPPLIADGARLRIHGPAGTRRTPLEGFCTGPGRTALARGELVTHIEVPAPAPHTGKVYIKHGRRAQMELATVGVAAHATLDADGRLADVAIVLAAVAPTPLRAHAAEALLRGRLPDAQALAAAAEQAGDEARPIGDVRASAAYRRDMVRVLTARALQQAIREAQS